MAAEEHERTQPEGVANGTRSVVPVPVMTPGGLLGRKQTEQNRNKRPVCEARKGKEGRDSGLFYNKRAVGFE
jgi:hypothetical protein